MHPQDGPGRARRGQDGPGGARTGQDGHRAGIGPPSLATLGLLLLSLSPALRPVPGRPGAQYGALSLGGSLAPSLPPSNGSEKRRGDPSRASTSTSPCSSITLSSGPLSPSSSSPHRSLPQGPRGLCDGQGEGDCSRRRLAGYYIILYFIIDIVLHDITLLYCIISLIPHYITLDITSRKPTPPAVKYGFSGTILAPGPTSRRSSEGAAGRSPAKSVLFRSGLLGSTRDRGFYHQSSQIEFVQTSNFRWISPPQSPHQCR